MEAVFGAVRIPVNSEESLILNLYKGLGSLDRDSYHSLKLPYQVMKLLESVLTFYTHKMVNIDQMQLRLVPSKGTTETITARQQQEQYITANKPFYAAFIDLGNAFDHLPWKVPWWAWRSLSVEEWAVCVIQGMYSNAPSHVQVNGQYSEEFGMGICLHQGFVLGPLLFIQEREALWCEFSTGVRWELR